mmetsp:Transcript_37742/g.93805  ORF Transcript_37742/g.93805 Transcript_37742/m.93805 type:complete len:277 (+) Transcript_37742:282-1112(+)
MARSPEIHVVHRIFARTPLLILVLKRRQKAEKQLRCLHHQALILVLQRPFVRGPDAQVEHGAQYHQHQRVEENVMPEEPRQPLQVMHLLPEDEVGGGEARVRAEGSPAELDEREGAQLEQPDVEEHRVDQSGANPHRMDGYAEEAHAELHVALEKAEEQVEGEEAVRQHTEEREDVIQFNEERVEEERGGRRDEDVDKEVEEPHDREADGHEAADALEEVSDGVAASLFVRDLHPLPVFLQEEDGLLELVVRRAHSPILRTMGIRPQLLADLYQLL